MRHYSLGATVLCAVLLAGSAAPAARALDFGELEPALAPAWGSAAQGAEEAQEAGVGDPTELVVPYLGELETKLPREWRITSCSGLELPPPVRLDCSAEGLVLTTKRYEPGYGEVVLPVPVHNGASGYRMRFRVRLAPPAPPMAHPVQLGAPATAGTPMLLPYAALGLVCQGCAETPPTVQALGVEPAEAGALGASPSHLVFFPRTGWQGVAVLYYRAADPYGAWSEPLAVTVPVAPAGAAAAPARHTVITVPRGLLGGSGVSVPVMEALLLPGAQSDLRVECRPAPGLQLSCDQRMLRIRAVSGQSPAEGIGGPIAVARQAVIVLTDLAGAMTLGSVTVIDDPTATAPRIELATGLALPVNASMVSVPVAPAAAGESSGALDRLLDIGRAR